MNNVPTITKKTNKQVIIDYIVSCLKKGESRGNIVSKVGRKWQKEPRTVDRMIKIAKQQHAIEQQAIQKELMDVEMSGAIEAAKKGVNSKIDRLLNLIKQVEGCQADLDKGTKTDYIVIGGKLQKVVKELTPLDNAYIRKAMRDLQAEVSKIEGDYAPDKVAQTDTEGNDIEKPYSRAEILEFLNQANG